jgi:adenosylcobinamide-GDP ribazoletransferase
VTAPQDPLPGTRPPERRLPASPVRVGPKPAGPAPPRADGAAARWWQVAFAPPVLALQFLTAVPIPIGVPAGPRQLGRALGLFPLVGAMLGLALGGLDALLRLGLPSALASALVLIGAVLLTGGLHLDGLMDACDGLFGGRTVERRLEIMRDSRVGAFGVLGGVLQLLLKYAALESLPGALRGPALVASLAAGRWAMVAAIWGFPYARPQGLGAVFKAGVGLSGVAVATLLALVATALPFGPAGLQLGPLLLGVAAVLTGLAGRWMAARLGGLTGDTYGAIDELVEATSLVAIVALSRGLLGVAGG